MKEKLLARWEMDRSKSILAIGRFAIGIMFVLSMLLPYAKGSELIGETISLRSFPGGGVLTLLVFLSVVAILYLIWMERDNMVKRLYLMQAILVLLIVLYGILMYTVGIQSQTTNVRHGLGYGLGLLMVISMWGVYVLEAKVMAFLEQRFPSTSQADNESMMETQS